MPANLDTSPPTSAAAQAARPLNRGERRARAAKAKSSLHSHRHLRLTRRGPRRGRHCWKQLRATFAILAIGAVCGMTADAAESSRAVTREFQREHPCPATGLQCGACPGWIKDHVIALACGGPDSPDNMQWQTPMRKRKTCRNGHARTTIIRP